MAEDDASEQLVKVTDNEFKRVLGPCIPKGAIVMCTGRYRPTLNNIKIEVIFQDTVAWVLNTSLGKRVKEGDI